MKQATYRGICWATTCLIPVLAILAVSTGLPIPFRGWAGGIDVAFKTPYLVVLFGVLLGGFIPLWVVAGVGGALYFRSTRNARDPATGSHGTTTIIATVGALIAATVAVGNTWDFFSDPDPDHWMNAGRALGCVIAWASALLLTYRAATGDWLPARWREPGVSGPPPVWKTWHVLAILTGVLVVAGVAGLLLYFRSAPVLPPEQAEPVLAPVSVIQGGEGQIQDYLTVSSDGRYLAFVNEKGGAIRVWDVELNKELTSLKKPGGMRFLFIPNQAALAVLPPWEKQTVMILPIDAGEKKRIIELPEANAGCMAISPDGKLLASGHVKAVHLVSLETGDLVKSLAFPENIGPIQSLAFTPDGQTLATGARTVQLPERVLSPVRFWDVKTGKEVGSLPHGPYPDESAMDLALSPSGDLAAYRTGMQLVIASKANGKDVLRDWRPSTNLCFSRDGRWVAWGDVDMLNDLGRRIQADADETTRKRKGEPPPAPGPRTDTVRLFLYDAEANTARVIFREQYPRVWRVAFCGVGKLATAHEDNSVRIWDLNSLMK